MLQREFYIMGNAGFLKRDTEMTNLQPNLGKTTHQQLRNSLLSPSPIFHAQLLKEGEVVLLKTDTPRNPQGVETLYLIDYQASNGPPVGGRLCSFTSDWLKENCSNSVLNIITNVYILPFNMKPKLSRQLLITSLS